MALLHADPMIQYESHTFLSGVSGWTVYGSAHDDDDGPYSLGRLRLGDFDNGGSGGLDSYNIRRALPEATGRTLFQWHVRPVTIASTVRFLDLCNNAGADLCLRLSVSTTFQLLVYNAAGTLIHTTAANALAEDVWTLVGIDAEIGSSSGALRIWVGQSDPNADPLIDLTGVDLTDGDSGGCDYIWLRGGAAGEFFDHALTGFYGDSSGTTMNAYQGLRYWQPLGVSGAGASATWTPNTGTNHGAIDDVVTTDSDGDTTYNESPASAGADTFAVTDSTAALHGIAYAAAFAIVRQSAAGTPGACQLRLRSEGGTNSDGSTLATTTSWTRYYHGSASVPGGSGWTKSDVDGLQIGYVSAGDSGAPYTRVTAIFLAVFAYPDDYYPPDPPPTGGWPTSNEGSTIVRAELVIEGWPDAWVTDRSITWAPGTQTVRLGLSLEGLTVADRVVMYEASCTQDGNTFKIKPPARRQQGASQWDDVATASFSRRPNPVGILAGDLEAAVTTLPALQGGASLSNNTTYWLGTEAIRIGTAVIDNRGHFSSIDQSHFIPARLTDAPLYIWDYPPTMEGRRTYLYVWGNGDDGSTAGNLIWRGIVRRPPVLARSGVEWDIQCSGIVDQLKQRLAGDIKSAKVVGVYHHVQCAIKIEARYNAYSTPEPTMVVGWDSDEAEMCERINDALETVLAEVGADVFVDSCKLTRSLDQGLRLELRTTGVGADELVIWLSSPIIGGVNTFNDRWVDSATGAEYDGGPSDTLNINSTYYAVLTRPHPEYFHPRIAGTWSPSEPMDAVNPLGAAFEIMMPNRNTRTPFLSERWQSDDATDQINCPPWRVYVDDDFDGVEAVYIPGTDKPGGTFAVTTTGSNSHGFFIELEPWTMASPTGKAILTAAINGHPSRGFMGFLDGSTEIRARRNYGTGITVFDFIAAIHTQAPLYGNRADTPFVTTEDTTAWAVANGGLGSAALLSERDYIFFGPVQLYEMLQEELKLIGYFMRIDETGLVDAVPTPALTATSPVSGAHIIAAGDIITPADHYGAWPTWEPLRDGRITTVKYQTGYDAIEDDWLDPPTVFVDKMAISLSKARGKAVATIKPYSRTTPFQPFGIVGAWIPGVTMVDTGIEEMALRYLTLFAHDYDVVTLCVPFTKFDILCGDIVSVTSSHVPDGTGKRGITSVRGMVIQRYWPLDPQGDGYGRLTIMLVQTSVSGYAPSGLITGQTNTVGNTWNLTLSTTNAVNGLYSTNGDGLVLEHFAAGDYIRVVQIDAFSPTTVTGTISGSPSVSAGTCTVVLDGAWTPGASSWVLEFQEGSSTTAQKKYAYVADNTFLLTDGSFARRFA